MHLRYEISDNEAKSTVLHGIYSMNESCYDRWNYL